jgi:hypothetical protein
MIHTRPIAASPAPNPESADAPSFPAVGPAEARAERRFAVLAELTDIGMGMARGLGRRAAVADAAAEAASADDAGGDAGSKNAKTAGSGEIAMAFTRVARAVRLTVALEARLDVSAEDRARDAAREAARERAEAEAAEEAEPSDAASRFSEADRDLAQRVRRKIRDQQLTGVRLFRVVEKTLERDGRDADDIDRTLTHLHETLGEEEHLNLFSQSLGHAVERVCKLLDITPDWTRWAKEDWAIEEAGARDSSSPFARGGAPPTPPVG